MDSSELSDDDMQFDGDEVISLSSDERLDEMDSDDKLPPMITDISLVQLNEQKMKGVYLHNAKGIRNARDVAGYLGFEKASQWFDYYDQDDIKAFRSYYETCKQRNFDVVNESKKTNKKGQTATWDPMTSVASTLYTDVLPRLANDIGWVQYVRTMPYTDLPFGQDREKLPSWFNTVALGLNKNKIEFHTNLAAFVIRFMVETNGHFNGMYQPVAYKEHDDLPFTNEDFWRNYIALAKGAKLDDAKSRTSRWTSNPVAWDKPKTIGMKTRGAKKNQVLPAINSISNTKVKPKTTWPQLFATLNTITKSPALYHSDVYPRLEDVSTINAPDQTRPAMSKAEYSALTNYLEASASIQRRGTSKSLAEFSDQLGDKNTSIDQLLDGMRTRVEEESTTRRPEDDANQVVLNESTKSSRMLSQSARGRMTAWTPSYADACRSLGYTPEDPRPNGSTIPRMPHQTIATAWAADKEEEAMRTLIIGDPCGFGKTMECLDIVEESARRTTIYNQDNSGAIRRTYGITIVIAPSSIYGNWADDAKKFYPSGDNVVVITYYSKELPGIPNYSNMADLLRFLNELDPYDPRTGRIVIATTYGTFRKHAIEFNQTKYDDRMDRLGKKGRNHSEPKTHHDYDLKFLLKRLEVARIFLDEGHACKTPGSLTSIMVRCLPRKMLYFVSATMLENSIDDIGGVIYQLEKDARELGVEEHLAELDRLKHQFKANEYEELFRCYNSKISSYDNSRLWEGDHSDIPEGWNQGFYLSNEESPSKRYGLHLFTSKAVDATLRDSESLDSNGHVLSSVVRWVIGSLLKMIAISRTSSTKILVGVDEAGNDKFVTPVQGIPEHVVSTIDISPTIASDMVYQSRFAPLHGKRTVRLKDAPKGKDRTIDIGIERILHLASFSPSLVDIGMRTAVIRKFRLDPNVEVEDATEFLTNKHDNAMKANTRYPLPREWNKAKDNCASALCLLFQDDLTAQIPFSRFHALQILLKDSPKAVVLLREVLSLQREGKKVIIFVSWPIQMIYVEAILSLAEINVISLRSKDSPATRREKSIEFNSKTSQADALVAMWSVGAHGINLQFDCSRMIICDIVPNVNLILQMIGRLVRTGQTEEVFVSILALDRTYDIKRQSLISRKMIKILATSLTDPGEGPVRDPDADYDSDSVSNSSLQDEQDGSATDRRLDALADEIQRSLQGQSCSRLKFDVRGSKYIYEYAYGTQDPSIVECKGRWDAKMGAYNNRVVDATTILHDFDAGSKGGLWPARQTEFDQMLDFLLGDTTSSKHARHDEEAQMQRNPDDDYIPLPDSASLPALIPIANNKDDKDNGASKSPTTPTQRTPHGDDDLPSDNPPSPGSTPVAMDGAGDDNVVTETSRSEPDPTQQSSHDTAVPTLDDPPPSSGLTAVTHQGADADDANPPSLAEVSSVDNHGSKVDSPDEEKVDDGSGSSGSKVDSDEPEANDDGNESTAEPPQKKRKTRASTARRTAESITKSTTRGRGGRGGGKGRGRGSKKN